MAQIFLYIDFVPQIWEKNQKIKAELGKDIVQKLNTSARTHEQSSLLFW